MDSSPLPHEIMEQENADEKIAGTIVILDENRQTIPLQPIVLTYFCIMHLLFSGLSENEHGMFTLTNRKNSTLEYRHHLPNDALESYFDKYVKNLTPPKQKKKK